MVYFFAFKNGTQCKCNEEIQLAGLVAM